MCAAPEKSSHRQTRAVSVLHFTVNVKLVQFRLACLPARALHITLGGRTDRGLVAELYVRIKRALVKCYALGFTYNQHLINIPRLN